MSTAPAQASQPLDPAEVAAHYDELDRFYREFWGVHVHHGLFSRRGMTPEEATRQLIAVVAQEAAVRPGAVVCDVGCGYGGTARVLAREYDAQVTALTISAAQHAYAMAVEPDAHNPVYLLRDWIRNDLAPEAFDAVIAIESSEHMPDLGAFFEQSARVLKPGGRLVVCAWLSREHPRGWEKRWLIGPICREGRMRGMETVAEYHRLARAAGLDPLAVHDVSHQVKKTWSICAGRVVRGLVRDPAHRRFLLRDGGPNRVFAFTLLRIWLAYELGSMRYGILAFKKPSPEDQGTGSFLVKSQ